MNSRAAAIIIENGKVLLIQRIKRERSYWVLPGGSVEIGETQEQACRREAKEETGLDIQIVSHVQTFSNEGREEDYYLAKPLGGKLKLGEPERSRQSSSNQYILEWIDTAAIGKINIQPQQLKAIITEQADGVDLE